MAKRRSLEADNTVIDLEHPWRLTQRLGLVVRLQDICI